MIRTFVDAGLLIAAAAGRHPGVQPLAVAILDDANRVFLSTPFVRLARVAPIRSLETLGESV